MLGGKCIDDSRCGVIDTEFRILKSMSEVMVSKFALDAKPRANVDPTAVGVNDRITLLEPRMTTASGFNKLCCSSFASNPLHNIFITTS